MVQTTVPSLLIIGTDTVLGASPATAVQLAHACLAAGYHAVIPASWGDELIAARTLQRLNGADAPRVLCSCPLVSRRLSEHGGALSAMLLHFVAPPVATAQYLRAAYAPVRPTITYAGACPAGIDESIDVWLTPEALLRDLAERGISVRAQPAEFDSVIPPDRRRFFSDPGGTPSRDALQQLNVPAGLVELGGDDVVVSLGQHLLTGSRVLIDMSVALGCVCSGRTPTVLPQEARSRVVELEPPRAPSPVVDHSLTITLDASLPTPSAIAAPSSKASQSVTPRPVDQGTSRGTTLADDSAKPARPPTPVTPATPAARSAATTAASVASAARATAASPAVPATPAAVAIAAGGATRATSGTPVKPVRQATPATPVSSRRSPPGATRSVSTTTPVKRSDASRQLPRAFVARHRSTPRGVRQAVPDGKNTVRNHRRRLLWVAATSVAVGIALAMLLWRPA